MSWLTPFIRGLPIRSWATTSKRFSSSGKETRFDFSDPLVGLAAVANLGMGIPYLIAKAMSLGKGVVTAATYEYGNTFLIVSGLLNMLVAIDAYDVRLGRK